MLGAGADARYHIRLAGHRLGLRNDDLVRAFDQIRDVMSRSDDLVSYANEVLAKEEPPVVIWTIQGGLLVNCIEALMAYALLLRGVPVRIFLCDEFFPMCQGLSDVYFSPNTPNIPTARKHYDQCLYYHRIFEAFGLPYTRMSEVADEGIKERAQSKITSLSREDIFRLQYKGIDIGSFIEASVIRLLLRANLPQDAQTEMVIRGVGTAAIIMADIAEQALKQREPRGVLTSHGKYITWGIITELAKLQGIPVTVWEKGWRISTLVFRQDQSLDGAMGGNLIPNWDSEEWTPDKDHELKNYLSNRWSGDQDGIVLYGGAGARDSQDAARALGLDATKPTLGVFPNVLCDAHNFYRGIAFPDQLEWLRQTVSFFIDHPQWQLVIRAHPMEHWPGIGGQETVGDEIRASFPQLPNNIKLVPAESSISSYSVARFIRAATVYGTELGLELACRGVPVIVTAEAPFGGKGFTYDVGSPEEYRTLLRRLDQLPRLEPQEVEMALKYAYYWYFRRQVTFKPVEEVGRGSFKQLHLDSLHDLLPGRDPELDFIMEGILNGTPILHS